jgi:hypothetical protein
MTPQQVIEACEAVFAAHITDCSGFARAAAAELGIKLEGRANELIDQLSGAPWAILADGIAAKQKADEGYFVVAGLKDEPHGHIVVIVAGEIAHEKYPAAYWGSLKGAESAAKNRTINWAWTKADRDRVIYAAYLPT